MADLDWGLDLGRRLTDEAVWPTIVAEAERQQQTVGACPRTRHEAYMAMGAVWNYLLHHPDDLERLAALSRANENKRSGSVRTDTGA